MFVSNCTYRKPINIPNATHVCETYKHTYIQYIHQLLLHGARIPYQYIFVPPILTFQLGACHCTFSSPNVVIPSRFLASNVVLFSCDLFPLSQHTKRRWITIIREKVYDSSIIQHQVTNKSSSKYRLVRRNITRKYIKKHEIQHCFCWLPFSLAVIIDSMRNFGSCQRSIIAILCPRPIEHSN